MTACFFRPPAQSSLAQSCTLLTYIRDMALLFPPTRMLGLTYFLVDPPTSLCALSCLPLLAHSIAALIVTSSLPHVSKQNSTCTACKVEYCSSIARVWQPKLEYRTHNAAHSVMDAILERYFSIVTCDTLMILEPYLTLRAVLGFAEPLVKLGTQQG